METSILGLGGVDSGLKAVVCGGSGGGGDGPSRPICATHCHLRSLKSLAAFCSQGLSSLQKAPLHSLAKLCRSCLIVMAYFKITRNQSWEVDIAAFIASLC